jgi:hypothetical protein
METYFKAGKYKISGIPEVWKRRKTHSFIHTYIFITFLGSIN